MDEIKLYSKNIKKNSNGNVLKYLSVDKNFYKISEVYFSTIKKLRVKAWKKNLSSEQFMYVFKGKIEIIIYNDRVKKNKNIKKFILGHQLKYSKILLPKNVWYGFRGLENENILINALKLKHKKCRMTSLERKNKYIPFNWK